MPIVLPQVDYSPLYRAIALKGEARTAGIRVESLDVVSRMRDLQERQRKSELVFGVAELLLQFGQNVYGIFEQQKLEAAKADLHGLQQEMIGKIQTYIDNNQFSWSTDNKDNKVMKMPPEFDQWYQQSLSAIEEKYKSFQRVRSWAKDQLYQMYDQSTATALNYGRDYAMKQTLQGFNRNLDNAMTDAVNAGDFATVEAVINSARNWLGDPQADNLIAAKRGEFTFRVHEKQVRAISATEGFDAAVAHIHGMGLSAEETQSLIQAADNANRITKTAILDQVDTAYRERLKQGDSPSRIITEILKTVPKWLQDDVEDRLRGIQAQIVSEQTLDQFTDVRDDVKGLQELYDYVKEDAGGRYEGIPVQHEKDLRMIENRLQAEKQRQEGMSPSDREWEKEAHRQWIMIRAMMDRGEINWHQAWKMVTNRIYDLSPSVAGSAYNELRKFMPEQVQPFMKTLQSDVERIIRDWEGLKPREELSPEQLKEIRTAQGYVFDAAVDAIRRKPDITATELHNEVLQPMAQLYTKSLKVLREPAMERPLKAADKTLAQMQALIETEDLGGLVYHDLLTGRVVYAPGLEESLQQLYSRQQQLVAEELGVPFEQVEWKQAPDMQGGIGLIRHYVVAGKEYRFFVPDPGKPEMKLYEWNETLRTWIPVHPAEGAPLVPIRERVEEETRRAKERATEALRIQGLTPPAPEPPEVLTPEEEAKKRAQEALKQWGFKSFPFGRR